MAAFASNDASLPIDLHAERVRYPARLWAEEFHSRVSDRIERFSASERQATLTPRQTECLAAAADGYSAKQIAPMLGLTIRTVEMHWCEAKKQLGARTTPSAVATAIRAGLI